MDVCLLAAMASLALPGRETSTGGGAVTANGERGGPGTLGPWGRARELRAAEGGREDHHGCVDVRMSGWTSRCLGPWGGDHGMDANSRHTRPHSHPLGCLLIVRSGYRPP